MIPTSANTSTSKHPLDDAIAMRDKVDKDIAFLTDKIERMTQQSSPNNLLIAHYSEMLKGRQAVLKWLMDGEAVSQAHAKTQIV